MNALDEMKQLTKQMQCLDESIPSDLHKLILLNTKMLQPLGKMYADATKQYKHAYAQRKYAQGNLQVYSKGTGVERTGQAEIGANDARKTEADAEGEMVRWKHAFISTQELVQSYKIVLKAIITELQNTNSMN